jgi:hypothetical protein
MLRLHGLCWGAKRLSKEFGCARASLLREGGSAHSSLPFGTVHSMAWKIGSASGFSVMTETRT